MFCNLPRPYVNQILFLQGVGDNDCLVLTVTMAMTLDNHLTPLKIEQEKVTDWNEEMRIE